MDPFLRGLMVFHHCFINLFTRNCMFLFRTGQCKLHNWSHVSHTAKFVGVQMKTGFPLGIRGRVGRLRAARVAQEHKPMHKGGQSQRQLGGLPEAAPDCIQLFPRWPFPQH